MGAGSVWGEEEGVENKIVSSIGVWFEELIYKTLHTTTTTGFFFCLFDLFNFSLEIYFIEDHVHT